jgi:hypothetical protein
MDRKRKPAGKFTEKIDRRGDILTMNKIRHRQIKQETA